MSELALRIDCPGAGGFRLQLDCALPGAGVTAVCGPSGSGKTTLLHCVAGLRDAGAGGRVQLGDAIWQDGARVAPPWAREIGYVFSDARLFPHLTVQDNLRYALSRRARGDRSKQAGPNQAGPNQAGPNLAGPNLADVVDWLDLNALLPQLPGTLSAGQQQRVAIGRALLRAPRLLLLDEPLANLDERASEHCLRCLQRLARELALPMLYVSHDIEEVTQLAEYLLLLEDGRAVANGPLLELCSRLDNRLSEDESAAAILSATVAAHDEAFGLSELHVAGQPLYVSLLRQPAGTPRRVRIPARDVSLCRTRPRDSSILNILPVTIAEMSQSGGARVMLRLALGDQFLLARITRKSAEALALAPGDELFAQIKSVALLMDGAAAP